jgi:hypothetical protein
MVKKMLVLGLLALLVFSGTASAGKKKGPKPYESEEVTVAVAHPIGYSTTGSVNTITGKEFEATCAAPSSNGLDAAVFEVPADYQKVTATVEAIGADTGPAGYDLDIYLYDTACKNTLAFNATGTDEVGTIPKGTGWILVHNYLGDPGVGVHITLKPFSI